MVKTKPIITQAEAARRLGVSRQRVRELVKSGRIGTVRFEVGPPMIRLADFDKFMATRAT